MKKIVVAMSTIIVLLSGILVYEYSSKNKLGKELTYNYNRAFYDMVGYVDNIKTIMTKASVCKGCAKRTNLLEEIWHKANMAQENLNMMPIEADVLKMASKYLNQVGDFAYSLSKQSLSKKELTDKQYTMLRKLKVYSDVLMHSLEDMEKDISKGKFRWDKLKRMNKNVPSVNYLGDIQKNFCDYPTLIYDGPFSDNASVVNPKGLVGKNVSKEVAMDVVKKFLDYLQIRDVEYKGITKGQIVTYNFLVHTKDNNVLYVDVTRVGGHVYSIMSNQDVGTVKLNIDDAKKIASNFLKKKGYSDMIDTYYLNDDNIAVINFAYKKGSVLCYPDLIKVKVALDKGDVVGIEAGGYITSHIDRNIPECKITLEEAQEKINDDVKITGSRLAIIPTEMKTEVLTYEFRGKVNNNDVLVYINTDTGEVENILMIIDTPNGILTM